MEAEAAGAGEQGALGAEGGRAAEGAGASLTPTAGLEIKIYVSRYNQLTITRFLHRGRRRG